MKSIIIYSHSVAQRKVKKRKIDDLFSWNLKRAWRQWRRWLRNIFIAKKQRAYRISCRVNAILCSMMTSILYFFSHGQEKFARYIRFNQRDYRKICSVSAGVAYLGNASSLPRDNRAREASRELTKRIEAWMTRLNRCNEKKR